ncbi:hypothetical protein [Armatimonas sp.]|uniref:hypothetical protein n=1 Tax=Armatimonas sp. TaxID=1872638 RepID=UPI00286CE579|nr:hypothetical protein [Armatimonas sp.]
MSTKALTRYFAILLTLIAGSGIVLMLTDIFSPGATPWNYFYLWVSVALLGVAHRLAAQRRWAVVVCTLVFGLAIQNRDLMSYLYLTHAIAGALVLFFRWRELKSGI